MTVCHGVGLAVGLAVEGLRLLVVGPAAWMLVVILATRTPLYTTASPLRYRFCCDASTRGVSCKSIAHARAHVGIPCAGQGAGGAEGDGP